MEGVKQQIHALEGSLAKQSDIDDAKDKLIEFSQVITRLNKTVNEVEKESASTRQFTENKLQKSREAIQ